MKLMKVASDACFCANLAIILPDLSVHTGQQLAGRGGGTSTGQAVRGCLFGMKVQLLGLGKKFRHLHQQPRVLPAVHAGQDPAAHSVCNSCMPRSTPLSSSAGTPAHKHCASSDRLQARGAGARILRGPLMVGSGTQYSCTASQRCGLAKSAANPSLQGLMGCGRGPTEGPPVRGDEVGVLP